MSKIIFRTLDNLQNEPTAIAVFNQNFAALQTLIDTLLSRDGAVPNQMVAILDMNGHKVINLPAPTTPTEPARHGDIQQYVDQASDFADAAEASAEAAQESEEQTLVYYTDFLSRYLGAYASDPTLDALGNPLVEGALYFNTTTNQLNVWAVRIVMVNSDVVLVGSDVVHDDTWEALPINTLNSLDDVDVTGITTGQFLRWSTGLGQWVPFTLSADSVPFDDGTLTSDTVQDAIEEVVSRTLLDVYDVQFYLQGLMAEDESLFRYVALRALTVPSDTTGFVAKSNVAATGSTTLTLKKNGTQFGTIIWSAAGTVGAWTIPGDTVFAAGDVMTIQAPTVPDTTLRDVVIGMIVRR